MFASRRPPTLEQGGEYGVYLLLALSTGQGSVFLFKDLFSSAFKGSALFAALLTSFEVLVSSKRGQIDLFSTFSAFDLGSFIDVSARTELRANTLRICQMVH